jgi:cob(I)alamin adenosyltransferase
MSISPDTTAKKGLVLAYIGDGKGKTTAAMGLVARASGAGLSVYVLQFVKAQGKKDGQLQPGELPLSSEINFFNEVTIPRGLGKIVTEQVGLGFVGILGDRKDKTAHIKAAIEGLNRLKELMREKVWDVIVCDELITALELGLLTEADLIDILQIKPQPLSLVLTGHKRFKKLFEHCDLVTEMKMIKHPYYKGILARAGIDF